MFNGATSFNRQLGGAWSNSTAGKLRMFYDSPGTIAARGEDERRIWHHRMNEYTKLV